MTPTRQPASGRRREHAPVALRLPADNAYASILRTTTVALAARLDFTLDDIEDVRMAVGEASALVLLCADDDSELSCDFHLGGGRGPAEMTIVLTVASSTPVETDLECFAWQVLDTLASAVAVEQQPGRYGIRLTVTSSVDLS